MFLVVGLQLAIPPQGATITIEGIKTAGDKGNFPLPATGLAADITSGIRDEDGITVTDRITAVVSTPATGGQSEEELPSIKQNAPALYATQDRVVTETDHEATARSVSGVKGAKAIGGEKLGQYGTVLLAVHGERSANVSQSLIQTVQEEIDSRDIPVIPVKVVPPINITVDLDITVYVYSLAQSASVRAEVGRLVTEFIEASTIGSPLYASVLQSRIVALSTASHANVELSVRQFGEVLAGRISIPVITNIDESSLFLTQTHISSEPIWSFGDSEYSIIDFIFATYSTDPEGTELTLHGKPSSPDLYPQFNQLFSLGQIDVAVRLEGQP